LDCSRQQLRNVERSAYPDARSCPCYRGECGPPEKTAHAEQIHQSRTAPAVDTFWTSGRAPRCKQRDSMRGCGKVGKDCRLP